MAGRSSPSSSSSPTLSPSAAPWFPSSPSLRQEGPALHYYVDPAEVERERRGILAYHGEMALASSTAVCVHFDVEASGQDLDKHGAVQMAAVASRLTYVRVGEHRRFLYYEEPSTFSVDLNLPEGCGWDEGCVRDFWEGSRATPAMRQLREKVMAGLGDSPKEAVPRLQHWLDALPSTVAEGREQAVSFWMDTSIFDRSFISVYLQRYGGKTPNYPLHLYYGGRFRDVVNSASVARGFAGLPALSWSANREADCRAYLRIPPDLKAPTRADHSAINDARHAAQQYAIHEACMQGMHIRFALPPP